VLTNLDGHTAVAVAIRVVLLVMSLPPITACVVLLPRGGAIVTDGGIAAGLVHILMGIGAVPLGLRIVPCGIVVATTDDHLGHGGRYR
jgi:hypothetical protein